MLAELNKLESDAVAELSAVGSVAELESWRVSYLGTKGRLKRAMGGLKDVPKADKPAVGKRSNEVKQALESAFAAKQAELGAGAGASSASAGSVIDMTEPGYVTNVGETGGMGRRHILSRVREELVEVFARMGFAVAEGPELEDDEHNFVKLNIPAQHPARDPIDNFYIDDPLTTKTPRMLRSQTSTVQIRVMDAAVREGGGRLAHPIKIVAPGRVYRPDTVDATHSFMFHQLEGLYIDRGVTMADLKSCLFHFARAYFGEDAEVRLRPSYFPFTEPSAEFDMKIRLKGDEPQWVELGGCGMVDPAVLEACKIDPEAWSGFAFGFGVERIAMGKYQIPDIRMLFENDLRFLEQI